MEVHAEPSGVRQTEDPLETSLVEPGPLLISLNPFEGEDKPMIRPTSGARAGVVTILTETTHEENTTETSRGCRRSPKEVCQRKGTKKASSP